jgi:dienelactone hydrolase
MPGSFSGRVLFRLLLVTLCISLTGQASAGKPTARDLQEMTTPDGVEFVVWGGEPGTPAPTLIILSGNRNDSLVKANFLKAGETLQPLGYLCVSIDLPCHGALAEPGYSNLTGWGKLAAEGEDFVADFNDRMKKVLDHLIAEGMTDPEKIAATGTSRGGFMAYRYLAFDERVKCAVGYSPVTDLRQLREFAVAAEAPIVDAMNIRAHVGQLVGRPLFLMIGDRDDRVGTDAAIDFMRRLSAAAVAADVPSQNMLVVKSEPRGHSTPARTAELATAWIYQQLEGKALP